jgi:hypothetical protein
MSYSKWVYSSQMLQIEPIFPRDARKSDASAKSEAPI